MAMPAESVTWCAYQLPKGVSDAACQFGQDAPRAHHKEVVAARVQQVQLLLLGIRGAQVGDIALEEEAHRAAECRHATERGFRLETLRKKLAQRVDIHSQHAQPWRPDALLGNLFEVGQAVFNRRGGRRRQRAEYITPPLATARG